MRVTIFLIVALWLGSAQQATACKCGRDPNAPPEGSEAAVTASLEFSDAVFTGRVVGVQSRLRLYLRLPRYWLMTRGGRELSDEQEDRMFRRRVRLKVEQAFKGVKSGKVMLYTGWGGGDCGYDFRLGSRYLVYAHDSWGSLYAGICGATKAIEKAPGEISILRRLAKSGSKES
jgi:hypothetical protein